jgi:hypothetical protein
MEIPTFFSTVFPGDREPPEMQHAIIDYLEAKGNPNMKIDFIPIR